MDIRTPEYVRLTDFDNLQSPRRPKKPTWLKTYVRDLDCPRYLELSLAVRGFLADLTKLAAAYSNRIPRDPKLIAGKLSTRPQVVSKSLSTLHRLGFVSYFAEDLETSKNRDLERLTDNAPIRPSPSTSQSESTRVVSLNKTTGDDSTYADEIDIREDWYAELEQLHQEEDTPVGSEAYEHRIVSFADSGAEAAGLTRILKGMAATGNSESVGERDIS